MDRIVFICTSLTRREVQNLLIGVKVISRGFPSGTSGKAPACQCGRHEKLKFDPWVGKIPYRNGNPLQYSCLENLMDRKVWQAIVHSVAKSQMQLE